MISKKLILDYINKAKVRGFINWRNSGHTVQGVVLDKGRGHIDTDPEWAVELSLLVFFKKACGSEHATNLIKGLKQKYVRRPAFLDELNKIK